MKENRFLYWAPRILAILLIAFLFLFSLDVFDPAYTVPEMIVGFLLHNLPVFVLIVALVLAWKREIVGTIVFGTAAVGYAGLVFFRAHLPWQTALAWSMVLSGPALLVSLLFLLCWRQRNHAE